MLGRAANFSIKSERVHGFNSRPFKSSIFSKCFKNFAFIGGFLAAIFLISHANAQVTTTYSYDELGRLIQSNDTQSNTHQYNYDKAGNRTQETAATSTSPGFRINSVTGTEKQVLNFTVTRSSDIGTTQTVDYKMVDGTAVAAVDYNSSMGTLTFYPGDSSKIISVPAIDDSYYNTGRSFTVVLSNPTGGASIAAANGTGTITDDDPAPVITISNSSAAEGSPLIFTLTKTGLTKVPATVTYAAGGGTATPVSDYTPVTATVTFAPGDTSIPVSVPTFVDSSYDPGETVNLSLSNPVNVGVGGPGIGAINDEAGAPVFSVASVAYPYLFRVTKSGSSVLSHSVTFAVTGGTAVSGTEYTAIPTQTLTFDSNTYTLDVPLTPITDGYFRGARTVVASLSVPSNGATLSTVNSTTTQTIQNVAPVPHFMLSPTAATVTEGQAVSFTVRPVNENAQIPIAVDVVTASGSAVANVNFTPIANTLTFQPGDAPKSVTIQTLSDGVTAPAKLFTVMLTNPTNGSALDPQNTATVTVNDANVVIPTLVNDTYINKGPSASNTKLYYVLSNDTDSGGAVDLPLTIVSITPNGSTAAAKQEAAAAFSIDPTNTFLEFNAPPCLPSKLNSSESVTYTAKNQRGGQSTATVVVNTSITGPCN